MSCIHAARVLIPSMRLIAGSARTGWKLPYRSDGTMERDGIDGGWTLTHHLHLHCPSACFSVGIHRHDPTWSLAIHTTDCYMDTATVVLHPSSDCWPARPRTVFRQQPVSSCVVRRICKSRDFIIMPCMGGILVRWMGRSSVNSCMALLSLCLLSWVNSVTAAVFHSKLSTVGILTPFFWKNWEISIWRSRRNSWTSSICAFGVAAAQLVFKTDFLALSLRRR